MSRIEHLIAEIKAIGPEPGRRNAIEIHRILDGNSQLFIGGIDPDYFNPILKNFGSLSESNARDFAGSHFKMDYSRNYELLMFYFNRV